MEKKIDMLYGLACLIQLKCLLYIQFNRKMFYHLNKHETEVQSH